MTDVSRDPFTGVQIRIGVMGSAGGDVEPGVAQSCRRLGRELVNINSSDIVIVIGGRSGTLGEFAIAYEHGKLIGVLTGTGGITAALPELERSLQKRTGSALIYEADPAILVDRLLARYQSPAYECACIPRRAATGSNED